MVYVAVITVHVPEFVPEEKAGAPAVTPVPVDDDAATPDPAETVHDPAPVVPSGSCKNAKLVPAVSVSTKLEL